MESTIVSPSGAEEQRIPLAKLNGDATDDATVDELSHLLGGDSKEKEKVKFDPHDPTVSRRTEFGVWEYWEDISAAPTSVLKFKLPNAIAAKIKVPKDVYKAWPSIQGWLQTWLRLSNSAIPSLDIWYNSQLLRMIEKAVETRSVDKDALLRIAAGQVAVSIIGRVLDSTGDHLDRRFDERVTNKFALRAFHVAARLDVPTHNDPSVRETIDDMWYSFQNPLTRAARSVVQLLSDVVNFATQFVVLISVLQGHYEGARFLIVVGLLRLLYDIARESGTYYRPHNRGAWALKTRDDDYQQKTGLEDMVRTNSHRQDIVAGGLGEYLSQEYARRTRNLGDKCTDTNRIGERRGWKKAWGLLLDHAENPFDVFCQIYTCLQVVNSPSSTPFSLSTLHLVTSTVSSLNSRLSGLGRGIEGISDDMELICEYYKAVDMPNKIKDGTLPFPENEFDLSNGISVEFRNVSFKYPEGTGQNVISNLSFKIEQGQLCVIVGENGSGKSTILTLLTRIYDVTEGQILLNGHDIRTLRLADVRKAVAVLFQEYNVFPLPFAENIGLGDPQCSQDMGKIQRAAELGGAQEFIEALPHKYGTYLFRPVQDGWDPDPSKNSIYAGKEIDFEKLKLNEGQSDLSGGQKQRIALARTFMKSVVSSEHAVGLLLFDEPSASLDPKAEHDLFIRLRKLRGSKTMIFSSHRFGKLTRHADLIIYIAKGELVEAGDHVELMKKDGEYAKFWKMRPALISIGCSARYEVGPQRARLPPKHSARRHTPPIATKPSIWQGDSKMGPWTQFDEDDYRLPEGMKRIGYDSDEGRYYFRDSDGSIWRGAEGAEYGELTKVSEAPASVTGAANDDVEASPRTQRQGGYQLLSADPDTPLAHSHHAFDTNPYRALFPFFLIIAVVLLLIYRLILSPAIFPGAPTCPQGTELYYVQPGESCWAIAKMHDCSLEKLQALNPKVVFAKLTDGHHRSASDRQRYWAPKPGTFISEPPSNGIASVACIDWALDCAFGSRREASNHCDWNRGKSVSGVSSTVAGQCAFPAVKSLIQVHNGRAHQEQPSSSLDPTPRPGWSSDLYRTSIGAHRDETQVSCSSPRPDWVSASGLLLQSMVQAYVPNSNEPEVAQYPLFGIPLEDEGGDDTWKEGEDRIFKTTPALQSLRTSINPTVTPPTHTSIPHTMVETVQPPHPPALKVGGRRLSVSNKPKPTANAETAESPTDAREEEEEERKRRKKPNFDKHPQGKADNRPTRDTQSSYKAFAGNRIAQPAGKGLGI
ncbi:hypothetical protein NMY22_g10441 [Coprinellus aureogranulatus]|nr:hypothetical protein NMY22_g10441 [Coprinellus aureogranulatus]